MYVPSGDFPPPFVSPLEAFTGADLVEGGTDDVTGSREVVAAVVAKPGTGPGTWGGKEGFVEVA